MRIFYKPSRIYFILDVLMLLLSFYVVLDWFPLTTNTPFNKYSWPSLYYSLTWIISSYFFQRYKPLKKQQYFGSSLRLFYTAFIAFIIYAIIIHLFFKIYSGFVLLTITLGVFFVNYLFLSLYYAYRFAVEYNDVPVSLAPERENAQVKPAIQLDEKSLKQLKSTIRTHSGDSVLKYLQKYIDLSSGNTLVYNSTEPENLQMIPNYQYSSIVQLKRLNDTRGVNRRLTIINEKLPDHGMFVCCFESKSTRKKRILENNPKGLNYVFYTFDYLYKRVMPRLFLTRNLYYFITRGNNRIFSKTEVLGRLYCFGFKVVQQKKIGHLTYVFAQRENQPTPVKSPIYGPLIRLRRFGKDGEPFEVYKMRTMHPYSEYLQSYIYECNSLKEGGKFNKDIRVTTTGGIMRKYWFDELPMLLNLLKGEMKLVGVRPLSAQYFNLYSKELQAKRVKFKPGLLPPFYADMPRTLDEIQESEMTYLIACEERGEFLTDSRYILLILKNILFKKARSG
ncbi:MAG: sugar transferase [Bacteroidota bacterium]|nr:sugar transferase [Bacteroidota bacterium]